jgi:hypothetical protein
MNTNKMNKLLIISILPLLFFACKSETKTPENDCPYGEPRPILIENAAGVTNYKFEVKGQNSIETAVIQDTFLKTNNLTFSLFQSGCENIKQEYRFELPTGNYAEEVDSFFVQRAAEGLKVIAERNLQAGSSFIPNFAFDLFHSAGYVPLNQHLPVDRETSTILIFIIRKIAIKQEGIVSIEFLNE